LQFAAVLVQDVHNLGSNLLLATTGFVGMLQVGVACQEFVHCSLPRALLLLLGASFLQGFEDLDAWLLGALHALNVGKLSRGELWHAARILRAGKELLLER
jgi:hypothetical protein